MIGECNYCYISRGLGAAKCPYCGRVFKKDRKAAALEQARREGASGEYRRGVEEMQTEVKRTLVCYSGTYHSIVDAIDEAAASLLSAPKAGDLPSASARVVSGYPNGEDGQADYVPWGDHAEDVARWTETLRSLDRRAEAAEATATAERERAERERRHRKWALEGARLRMHMLRGFCKAVKAEAARERERAEALNTELEGAWAGQGVKA